MRKLLVLGASYSQKELIRSAKKMGVKTIVASLPGGVALSEADEVQYVDITNPSAVLRVAQENQVNGIATCCMDTGIISLGHVCEKMELPGLSEASGIMSKNKALMKEAFEKHGVNTARFRRVSDFNNLEKALNELQLPLIIKAIDLQGGRGIYVCRTNGEVRESFRKVMEDSKESFCIIEEFIEGYEFGAASFVYNGGILYVLPHNDELYTTNNSSVPIGHSMPFAGDNTLISKIFEQTLLAIKATGLNNCAVNVDLIAKGDEVYVIELTGRLGATCLPELISTYYGIDIFQMIIATALGDDPTKIFSRRRPTPQPCMARVLYSEQSGVVKSISNNNKDHAGVVDISYNVSPGSSVNKFTVGGDRIGQVVVKGNDLNECRKLIDEVISNIVIELE